MPPVVVDIVSLGPKFNVKSNFLSKNDIIDTLKTLVSQLNIVEIDSNVKYKLRTVISKNISQNLKIKVL